MPTFIKSFTNSLTNRKYFLIVIFASVLGCNLIAQPCLPGWKYNRKITISNLNGALSDFQVLIDLLDTRSLINAGKMYADGRDIRFVSASGSSLPYWIENGTINTTNTRIWVKVDAIAASPANTVIYMYYGNSSAFTFADGNSTFELFDDFSGAVSQNWDACNPANVQFDNGIATLTTGNDEDKALISTKRSFSAPVVAGLKITSITGSGVNKKAFLGQHLGDQNGYGLCYEPTANTIDIRPFISNANCFADKARTSFSVFQSGNNFWQMCWQSSSKQFGWADGAGSTVSPSTIYTDHGSPGNIHTSVGLYGGAATLKADWFFIRKYAANVNCSVSAETSLPTTASVKVTNNGPLCEGSSLQLSVDDIAGATYLWSKNGFPLGTSRVFTKDGVIESDGGDYLLTITPASPNPCPSYQVTEKVIVYPATQQGNISNIPSSVCYGSNSGTLVLNGQTGSVKRWEYSLTGGEPWYATANTSSSQNFNNLVNTTSFRVVVQSGICAEAITFPVTINVDPAFVSGVLSGAKPICKNNDITLNLNGFTGNIVRWLYSTDSLNWTENVSTLSENTFTKLTQTTWYKVEVSGGSCGSATTAPVKVEVYEPTLGGAFNGATICKGSSQTLSLAGQRGSILRWEMSYTGAHPWTTIDSQANSLVCENAQQTTWYRAVVQNGACNLELSAIDTVIVDLPAEAGILSGSDTVCVSGNSGKLTLKNYKGIISGWQESVDGNSWTDFVNSGEFYNYSNLTASRYFRALVKGSSGVCPAQPSEKAQIVVSAATIGGTISGSASLCATGNKGKLKLNDQTGKVIRWERSPSGNDPWFVIANTTDSLPYLNLSESTYYRAIVKSGACPVTASDNGILKVTTPSVAGIISGKASACANNNDGSLIIIGLTGEVKKWQKSTDLTNWSLAVNKTPIELEYKNLIATTHYRAIVQNGICPADTTPETSIDIYPMPVVNFEADTADFGKDTHFSNLSTITNGKIVTHNWDFDDGYSSSARSPLHKFTTPGTFVVKLNETTDKGCIDSVKRTVIVYDVPRPSFTFSDICFGDTVFFKNTSVITSGSMFYRWYFGDGDYSEDRDAKHYFTSSGTYFVKLVVESDKGTRDSVTREVNVFPRSKPAFSFENACAGITVTFNNQSVVSKGNLSYVWNLGEGPLVMALNPEHAYKTAGKYKVTLKSTTDKGCSDSLSKTVTVFPLPQASFECANVPYNQISNFIDSSKVSKGRVVKWSWDFGDAQTSTEQNPDYTYKSPGIYLVNLVVESDSGCVGSYSKNIEIYALPNASYSFSDVCEYDTVRFINASTIPAGSLTYLWDFGDKKTSEVKDPSHRYELPGSYSVRLIVTSDKGGKDTLIKTVNIFPKPMPDFDAPGVCDGFSTVFTNKSEISSGVITGYTWDFGEGTNSIQQNPVKQFLNPDVYNVSLKVLSDKGCIASITKPVEMYYAPVANFQADHVCLGSKVKLNNLSEIKKGTLQFYWNFADGSSSIESDPEHWYSKADTFGVKLISISDHNCKDSVVRKVIVRAHPVVDAGKDTTVVLGFPVRLGASGGSIYDWSPTESLDNSVIADPMARPRENTTYTVRIRDEYNCESVDSVNVFIRDEHRIIPTNVITPDSDGINDTWQITNIDFYEQAIIRIYSRWGEEVYRKTNYLQDWDGKNSNGDALPDGTYYYVITFPDITKNYSGAITVLRNK